MKSMSLVEFRKHAKGHECVGCGKLFPQDKLQPGRMVIIVPPSGLGTTTADAKPAEGEVVGMVCKNEKGGKKDCRGNQIKKVYRKGVSIRMETTKNGQPFYVEA